MSEKDRDEADMENSGPPPTPHEEIEMLLPWFVTGQLDSTDAKRVESYLEQHPEMNDQLALVRDEMDVSITEAEKLGSPRAGQLNALIRQIEAIGPARASSTSGIFAQLTDWLGSLQPRQLGFAAMAALVLIVAQGLTIGGLMRGGGEEPGYETASGPNATAQGESTKFLVIFNSNARAAEIENLLSEIDGSITSGPKAGGYYQITIGDKLLEEAEINALLKVLKARSDIISFASQTGN